MTDLRKAAEMALEALESIKAWYKWKGGPFENVMEALRQALAQRERSELMEQKPVAWIDSIKSGDRVLYDGDAARVFSVLRQRPIAPDYFKLDFDDGSYIDVNDNDLIANGKSVDTVNTSQERVDETAKCGHEPVGWMYTLNDQVGEVASTVSIKRFDLSVTSPYGRQGIDYAQVMTVKEFPLYTAPPKRKWVGLTDEEIHEVMARRWWDWEDSFDVEGFSRAIEAKLKEKNA